MHKRQVLLAGAALPFLHLIHSAGAAVMVGTVKVMYAGSLVNLMEYDIGPAFDTDEHGKFEGFAAGSNRLANEIKGRLRRGDVFISANPEVNHDLMGSANGDWVEWYVTFAQSPLVIGYNPSSRFAADLKSKPWYEVLQDPGIRIGRTNPKLDPKGKLAIELMQKAAQIYRLPDLSQHVLGAAENPAQVFPEEDLVGRLQSGKLDVGFFYSTETAELKIPAVTLPPEMKFSAHYTVTVLRDAPNPAGAAEFIDFLLAPDGRALMRQHGLDLVNPSIEGDAGKVPPAVQSALHK